LPGPIDLASTLSHNPLSGNNDFCPKGINGWNDTSINSIHMSLNVANIRAGLRVLYIAAVLPALYETFVYNELFALRAQGVDVVGVSVHPPACTFGDPDLENLATTVIPVYGLRRGRLFLDALQEVLCHPIQSLKTVGIGVIDALFSSNVSRFRRIKVLWQLLAALGLTRRVRPLKIHHIHAHMAHVPTTIAMYTAKQLGVPFSFTGHANDLFLQRTLLPEKLRRAKFTACISYWHRDFYRKLVRLPDEKLPLVRCGVSIPIIKRQSSAPDKPFTIMAVGRLVPKKGFDPLIRALTDLANEGKNFLCRIVGEGPQRQELQALIEQTGMQDRIHLVGNQSNRQVKAALENADLFVLPCQVARDGDRGGIPVALMEAMAAGGCVVTGDLPTVRELVIDRWTGLVVSPVTVTALVKAIQEMMENAHLRNTLAATGREWVNQEFSVGKNVARLLAGFGQTSHINAGSANPATNAMGDGILETG